MRWTVIGLVFTGFSTLACATGGGASSAAEPVSTADGQVVKMVVTEDGYVPSRLTGKVGRPISLAITRKTERTCAKEIIFEGQEGRTDLPLGETVEVTYTPKAPGEVKFGCHMNMMISGSIAVTE